MIQSILEHVQPVVDFIRGLVGSKLVGAAVGLILIGLYMRRKKYKIRSDKDGKFDAQARDDGRAYGVLCIFAGIVLITIKVIPYHVLIGVIT